MLDFNANLLSRRHRLQDVSMRRKATEERAMSGYDFELRSQVPYLPWMTARVRRYHWDSDLQTIT